jgi:hypothetical protein
MSRVGSSLFGEFHRSNKSVSGSAWQLFRKFKSAPHFDWHRGAISVDIFAKFFPNDVDKVKEKVSD